MPSKKKIKIKLIRSTISVIPKHKECVKGLGLRRMHQTVVVGDSPAVRGMINKVNYLLSVEEE
jgi:large subunit ribosomal protein L30